MIDLPIKVNQNDKCYFEYFKYIILPDTRIQESC